MGNDRTDAGRRNLRVGAGVAVVLVIGGFAIVVASGMLRGAAGSEPVPVVSRSSQVVVQTLYVHVAGAVREPGVYTFDAGARVADAIGAAGGLADDADRNALNLARPLNDGEQLLVPRLGEASAGGGAAGGPQADGTVDINTADVAALDTLPRVGPAIAQRIIDWREQNGPFTSVDDLRAVPGIGDKMLEGLRGLVRV